MKEITKIMYEAFDGTKFDTVTECYEYEKKRVEAAQKEKERIERIRADVEKHFLRAKDMKSLLRTMQQQENL